MTDKRIVYSIRLCLQRRGLVCIVSLVKYQAVFVVLIPLLALVTLVRDITAISSDSRPPKFEMLDINNCF